ncbi:MAG: hypothetical protein ACLVL2_08215 [Bacteroides cellulosilyticus]
MFLNGKSLGRREKARIRKTVRLWDGCTL